MTPPLAVPPPKPRLWRRLLLAAGLLVLLAITGVLIFREDLATRAALAYLESQGIPTPRLAVTRLTPGGLRIDDISLGRESEITARQLRLVPAWQGVSLALAAVEIDGLRLQIDLREDAPLLGSLQAAVDRLGVPADAAAGTAVPASGDSRAPAFSLPAVDLSDARVIVETPSGPLAVDLTGGLSSAGGDLIADFSARVDSELGRLQARLTGRRSADGGLQVEAAVEEGRLAWQGFAVAAFQGHLALAQSPLSGPRLSADLDLSDLSYTPAQAPPLVLARGHLTAKGELDRLAVVLDLDGAQEALKLDAEAVLAEDTEVRQANVTLRAEARTAGGLARFLPLPGLQVTQGSVVVEAAGSGALPAGVALPQSLDQALGLLPHSRWQLKGDAILAEVALAEGSRGISAHFPLRVEAEDNRLTLRLGQDAELRVERPARDSLLRLGLPEDLLPLVTSGLSLSLAAGGELPFRATATPVWPPREVELDVVAEAASDQGLKLAARTQGKASLGDDLALAAFGGTIDSRSEIKRLAIGGREARDLRLALPLAASYGAEGLQLRLTRGGEIRLGQFGAGAPLRLDQPLAFRLKALSLDAPADFAGYRYSLNAEEDGAGLDLLRAGADPLAIDAGALTLRLSGRFAEASGHDAELDLQLAGIALPGFAFAAEAAEVKVALDRDLRPRGSSFSFGPFQHGGTEPTTTPLLVTGSLTRAGSGYDVASTLGLAGGAALADIDLRYGDDGRARINVVSRALLFTPEGLQPAQISPLLGLVENVRGSVTADASLVWPPDPAQESARIILQGVGFKSPAGEVSGLNLDLDLERLQPLRSAAGQRLTIRSLEAAVPVEAIEMVFTLTETPTPRLVLEDGGFDLGGARWQVEPSELAPLAPRNRIVLATETLDLATLFRLIEVEGLAGRGQVRGRLPIEFTQDDIIVDDGHFEALGPGSLSLRIPALRSALAGGGETVELAIKALEDFQFDTLSVTLAKTAANDATVLLSILGKNPEVLDGQPFQFNINLESNLTSVLAALRQGYSLSDDALRRAWRLRE